MEVKINVPRGTHSSTIGSISRRLRSLLEETFSETRITLAVPDDGPVGAVYFLCHTGDPIGLPAEMLAEMDEIWRSRIPKTDCIYCGNIVWKHSMSTPRSWEDFHRDRHPDAPVPAPDAKDVYNWRIIASQHKLDCLVVERTRLATYHLPQPEEPRTVVLSLPVHMRSSGRCSYEGYRDCVLAVLSGRDDSGLMDQIQRENAEFCKLDLTILAAASIEPPSQ